MKRQKIGSLLLLCGMFFGIDDAMSKANCDVMKMATEAIARRFPHFHAAGLRPVVTERGPLWRLTYEPPDGMLGGVPVVTIDTARCTIVSIEHGQ